MTTTRSDLQGYHATEAEFPELRELVTFSAAWYRRWRELHWERYPNSDLATRANLNMLVDMAERREAEQLALPLRDSKQCAPFEPRQEDAEPGHWLGTVEHTIETVTDAHGRL